MHVKRKKQLIDQIVMYGGSNEKLPTNNPDSSFDNLQSKDELEVVHTKHWSKKNLKTSILNNVQRKMSKHNRTNLDSLESPKYKQMP